MTELGKRILRAAAYFHGSGASPPRGWQIQLCEWLSEETGKVVRQQSLNWAVHNGKQTHLAPLIAKRYGVDAVWLATGTGVMVHQKTGGDGNMRVPSAPPRITTTTTPTDRATPFDVGENLRPDEETVLAAMRIMPSEERMQIVARATQLLHDRILGPAIKELMRPAPPAVQSRRTKL